MKNTLIGIISYLPEGDIRQIRLDALNDQIHWLRSYFPTERIIVIAQCFHDDECVEDVEYVRYDHGLTAAGARDELFKIFYESDYDWLFTLDDDCIFENHFRPVELLNILDEDPNITNLDVIASINPAKQGFRQININKRSVVEEYFTFANTPRTIPIALVRNLKKYYNLEPYFKVSQDVNGVFYAEDFLWTKYLIYNGLRVRYCEQWIIKDRGNKHSAIISSDSVKENVDWHKQMHSDTVEHFKSLYHLTGNNYLNEFRKKYDVLNRFDNTKLNIKRLEHYEFTADDLDYKPRTRKK